MPFKFIAGFALTAACIPLTSCSKTVIVPEHTEQIALPAQKPSTLERIAEIDRILAEPPTGKPEDANRRAALRAERNALGSGGAVRPTQDPTFAQQQQAYAEAQAARDRQRTVDQLKYEAERSRVAEQQKLQAQRDQWEREDRLSQRKINGNYHPEAPLQNTYDIQIQRQRTSSTISRY